MGIVECRSDTEYAERPLAFTWEGERLRVEKILSRWREPDAKGFRVRTTKGQVFVLIYRERIDEWQVQPT